LGTVVGPLEWRPEDLHHHKELDRIAKEHAQGGDYFHHLGKSVKKIKQEVQMIKFL